MSVASSVRALLVVVIVGSILMLAPPAKAQPAVTAGGLSVDQVVATLAEVVKERAKQVAARTMQRKVVDGLCGSKEEDAGRLLELTYQTKPQQKRTLHVGGRKPCRESLDGELCNADDVFVRSCQRARGDSLSLTDPHFLKELGRDTISFLLRLAAIELDAKRVDDLQLLAFGRFIHDAMDAMARPDAGPTELAGPLERLADALSPQVAANGLRAVAGAKQTETIVRKLYSHLDTACPPKEGQTKDKACELFRHSPGTYLHPDLFVANKRDDICTKFVREHDQRDEAFDSMFVKGSLKGAANKRCPNTGSNAAACTNGQALFVVGQALQKALCHEYSAAPHRDFRNLLYILRERKEYIDLIGDAAPLDALVAAVQPPEDPRRGFRTEDDLTQLTGDALVRVLERPNAPKAIRAFTVDLVGPMSEGDTTAGNDTAQLLASAAAPSVAKASPYIELADSVRLFAALVIAAREDPKALAEWLEKLTAAVRAARSAKNPIEFLLTSAAFVHAQRPTSSAAIAVRDAAKNLVTTPRLSLLGDRADQVGDETATAASRAILTVLEQVGRMRVDRDDAAQTIRGLQATFTAFAEVAKAVARRSPSANTDAKTLSDSLSLTAHVLDVASTRDWVGLALDASDRVSRLDRAGELAKPMRFVRVLLSTYQAKTTEDAKAIMTSALEDEASREERFSTWTVDLAALLAPRVGYQWNAYKEDVPDKLKNSWIGGLYVPVGVQVAYRQLGILAYPLDLGSYLVATEKKEPPTASAAVRAGGALYWRFANDIPIDLGGAYDYRPPFDDRSEHRVMLFVALELPLFALR
jgi:hypothetical protein